VAGTILPTEGWTIAASSQTERPASILENRIMLPILRRLARNEQGATAIEYTMIASLIAVAAIASMRSVGNKVSTVLSNVAGAMT